MENTETGFVVGEWNELIGEDIKFKITEPGEGPIPFVGQLVRCKYVGRLVKTGEIFEVIEDTGYRIGDNDTTPALELGLRHMRKGEKALIHAKSKYGFGPYGRKNVGFGGEVEVPGEADIEYEAEVTEIYPTFNPKEAPTVTRLTEAGLKKQIGNGHFHHEDYNRAIRCYQSAVKSLDPAEVDEEEEGEEAMKEVIKVYCDISNNLAMALMKLERYKDACEVCVKVIELDPNNTKALYRGGMASMEQSKFDEADLALKEAFKLAPKDANVIKALKELARRKAAYLEKEKKMYRAMSGFLNKPRASSADEDKPDEEGSNGEEEGEEEEEEGSEEGDNDDGDDDDEDDEEEEEEDEGREEKGSAREGEAEGQVTATAAQPWVVRNYNNITLALFLILPLFFVYPDLLAFWRKKLGIDQAAGEQEL